MSSKGMSAKMPQKNKRRGPSRREEGLLTTRDLMHHAHNKAQKIFMKLAEETVSSDAFVEMARYINPEIYGHIVVDRGATGICGYPLCPKQFTDDFGQRMYKIRENKVYDISMRRNFCSNVCFEASEIVRGQISVEPLYVRENLNPDKLEVKVPTLESLRGCHGKLVDITGGLNVPYKKPNEASHQFTSFTQVAEESLKMCAENSEEQKEGNNKNQRENNRKTDSKEHKGKADNKEHKSITTVDGQQIEQNEVPNLTEKELQKWRQSNNDNHIEVQNDDTLSAVLKVEHAFREWMTFDSLRFILGDQFVRGMLEDFGQKWEDYDTTAGLKLGVESKAKYIALCRKLDEEERDDKSGPDLEVIEVNKQPRQPLPDYQQLQEDAKKQELKVVSFLGGQDQYEDVTSDHNNDTDSKDHKASLPLIDSHSQVEWRQAITLDKLDKYMRPFLPLTQLEESKIKPLINDLVVTFEFSPNNIIFKPGQWNLVTILILKLLSIRIPAVKYGLEAEEFIKFQETLLSTFNLDMGYLDRFLSYVTEIKYIIRKSSIDDENDPNTKQNDNSTLLEDDLLAEYMKKINLSKGDTVDRHEHKGKSATFSENLKNQNVLVQVSSVTEELD